MPPWTRASELARTLACPGSTRLPRTERPRGHEANFGTELHAWKAGAPPTPRVAAWLEVQPDPDPRATLWPGGEHEVLVWADPPNENDSCVITRPFAGRFAGPAAERDAKRAILPGTAVAGEIDWWTLDAPVPWVDDLKTGGYEPGTPRPQLYLYALAAAYLTDADAVQISVTWWPRYPLGTPPTRECRMYTRNFLEHRWNDVAHARRSRDILNVGEWCKFCPSRPHCPRWTPAGLLEIPKE